MSDHEEDLLLVCGIIVKAQWLSVTCICYMSSIVGVPSSIPLMGNCFDRMGWDRIGLFRYSNPKSRCGMDPKAPATLG